MDGSPRATSPDGGLEAAEKLIHRWDPSASPQDERMVFDGSDRAGAERYLRAVDEIRRSASSGSTGSPRRSSFSSSSPSGTIQIAMARLEDEFRHILSYRVNPLEFDSLSDLASLSLSSEFSGDFTDPDDDASHHRDQDHAAAATAAGGEEGSSHGFSYRSASGIREVELVPAEVASDLRSIAERMVAAGYGRECVQAYAGARKATVDAGLRSLGVERLSIGDVQRLEWEALEGKIRRWIRAARAAVRVLFASERRLCDLVFESLPELHDSPFQEAIKGAAIQLFSFPEAISIGRRSPEKLFKVLDLHDALSDLLPDVAAVFRSKSSDSIHTQAAEILARLAEAVRGILSEFENAVLRDPSNIPVPGCTIHPLTRYVMNYISLISDYKQTLFELIVSKPSAKLPGDAAAAPEFDLPESEDQSPLASHLTWIIVVLQHNLEEKAGLYRDASMTHLFLMNNVHYIVNKVKGSPELRELIGDEYLKRLTGKFRQSATSYQRATWVKILYCLRDEGIHVSGSFSSGVSKSTLRERFKSFNAAFDEAHRTQAMWHVPDPQLREELRISMSERLLPAYRSFLGRFRHHIESGRHPEMYIKYSVEDLEISLEDFFEGCLPSLHSRRRSH